MSLHLFPRLVLVREFARPLYLDDDPSHDFDHVMRVVSLCVSIAKKIDGELDLENLLAAALLHDVVNLPKNHPERSRASAMAAEKAKSILVESGFLADESIAIARIIEQHSYSAGFEADSIEAAILQDADRLDALGAIGIMRNVTTGTRMKSRYFYRENGVADLLGERGSIDDRKFMVDHFHMKLLKLPEKMNTAPAREMAERRAAFMVKFLEQLEFEVNLV